MKNFLLLIVGLISIHSLWGSSDENLILRETKSMREQTCKYLTAGKYEDFKKNITKSFRYSDVINSEKNGGEFEFKALTNKIYIPKKQLCSTLVAPKEIGVFGNNRYFGLRKDFFVHNRINFVIFIDFIKENEGWKIQRISISGE